MKPVLALLGALALLLGGVFLLAPTKAKAMFARASGFLDPAPEFRAPGPATVAAVGAVAPPAAAAAEDWRPLDRQAWRAFEAGEFAVAAATWKSAAAKAPPAEAPALRARADRANLDFLLSANVPATTSGDPAADEAEVRRRMDALPPPTARGWLEIADFAASRGLRHHLAFLYDRALETRNAAGGEAVPEKVKRAIQGRKAAGAAAPVEVLEAVIRELPSSEAADLAREDTGGVGGVEKRGEGNGATASGMSAEDLKRLEEARTLMAKGDAEYKLAIPGSAQVNVHRRAALDAYIKARAIYEGLDGGRGTYQKQLRDIIRDIAELRKDLPVGK
jgi:hypothetical protein